MDTIDGEMAEHGSFQEFLTWRSKIRNVIRDNMLWKENMIFWL